MPSPKARHRLVFPAKSKALLKVAGDLGLHSRPLRRLFYEPVTLKPAFAEEIAFYFLAGGGEGGGGQLAARLQQSPKALSLGVWGTEGRRAQEAAARSGKRGKQRVLLRHPSVTSVFGAARKHGSYVYDTEGAGDGVALSLLFLCKVALMVRICLT